MALQILDPANPSVDLGPHAEVLTTRRGFVGGIAALGTGLLALSVRSYGQTANPRRIDVHHHFIPEVYSAYEAAHATGGRGKGGRGGAGLQWTLSRDLEDMDQNGTATAILSITTPGFTVGDVEEVRKVVRGCNEAAAKLRSEHPGRFGSFASIPITDTAGALREVEYALDTRESDWHPGSIRIVVTNGSENSAFAPVYERAQPA